METRLKALESQSYALDIQIQHIRRRMASVENHVSLITTATKKVNRTPKQELTDQLSSLVDDLQQTIPKLEALQKQEVQPRARSRCAAVFDVDSDVKAESASEGASSTSGAQSTGAGQGNQVVIRGKTARTVIRKGTNSMKQSNASVLSDMTTEEVKKHLLSLLNKLVPSNFDALVTNFLKLEFHNPSKCTRLIAQMVFEKAINEPNNMGVYTRFIQHMCFNTAVSIAKHMRKEVLDALQAEFCRASQLNTIDSNGKGDCVKPEHSNQRSLAVMQLIAELFKHNLLTAKILCECVNLLLNDSTEENLLHLCKLLEHAGELLESKLKDLCETAKVARTSKQSLPKSKFIPEEKWMDQTFALLKFHASNTKLSMRTRIILTEVIELRQRSWQKRRSNEDTRAGFGNNSLQTVVSKREITTKMESTLTAAKVHNECGRANVHHLPVPDLIPSVEEVSKAHKKAKKRKKKTLRSVEPLSNFSYDTVSHDDDCKYNGDYLSPILVFNYDQLSYWRHRRDSNYLLPLCDLNTVENSERDLPKFCLSIPVRAALTLDDCISSKMPVVFKSEELTVKVNSEARADAPSHIGHFSALDSIEVTYEEEEAWKSFLFGISVESTRRVAISNCVSPAFLKVIVPGNIQDVPELIKCATEYLTSNKRSYRDQFIMLLEEAFQLSFEVGGAHSTATMSKFVELQTVARTQSIRLLFLRFLVAGYYHSFITFDVFKSKFLDPLLEADDTLPWFSFAIQSAARKLWTDIFIGDYSDDNDTLSNWWNTCELKIGKIVVADYTNSSNLVLSGSETSQ